jgi:hypothetical protein
MDVNGVGKRLVNSLNLDMFKRLSNMEEVLLWYGAV